MATRKRHERMSRTTWYVLEEDAMLGFGAEVLHAAVEIVSEIFAGRFEFVLAGAPGTVNFRSQTVSTVPSEQKG
jgi:hypothetical protein